MHIGIFIPNLNGGGAERVALLLAQGLVRKGHSVDIVLMIASGAYIDQVPEGVRLIDLNCPRLWTSTAALIGYLRRERPDALIASMPLANGIAGWARFLSRVSTRLILTEHNAVSLVFGDVEVRRYWILQFLIRYIYPFADCIVAVSEGVAKRLRTLPGIGAQKVHVIYNPAYSPSIEEGAGSPCEHPWLVDREIPVLLSVGRLVKQKDYPTLIRAFDLVRRERPARLIILGEDQDRGSLDQLIVKLGLTACAQMPGFKPNPWAWMSRASVFVLSSQHEGLPTVLIEAMACGTPIVSTDCPSGPSEILEGGVYGELVPVGDVATLAAAILRALKRSVSPELLKARARQFSVDAAVAGYLRVIYEACDGRNSHGK
jgi:glycosyltransferase involved in cell wall biosynthesis